MERFVVCSRGCRHWGAHGAAGLLIRRLQAHDLSSYLLVLRHIASHHGGTWGLPGGALKPGEPALTGAVRETEEEIGPLPGGVVVRGKHVDDHGRWAYTTLVVDLGGPFDPTAASWETAGLRWVTAEEAPAMPLHPGLRSAWPQLTATAEAHRRTDRREPSR